MKRTFTFSYSRKVSTAAYENADIFIAEGFEMEDRRDGPPDVDFIQARADIKKRVKAEVDQIAKEARA